jgi:hypothetical protein
MLAAAQICKRFWASGFSVLLICVTGRSCSAYDFRRCLRADNSFLSTLGKVQIRDCPGASREHRKFQETKERFKVRGPLHCQDPC